VLAEDGWIGSCRRAVHEVEEEEAVAARGADTSAKEGRDVTVGVGAGLRLGVDEVVRDKDVGGARGLGELE
jgi:hypothetical protein